MNENSLLALLAKLCGDIGINDNQDAGAILELQQAVASAIINEPALSFSNSFQFEQLDHFSTHHLDTANLEQLNNVLQRVQENQQLIDTSIRIFRRRVPFVSSQLRDSVPEWARGAQIAKTLGPFIGRDGIKYWYDLYRIIPVVQVWLQGAAQPFLLVPLEVGNLLNIRGPQTYHIPKGSVWIHAGLFASTAPGNLFCGLTVAGGTLKFTGPLSVNASNQLIVPNGMEAAVNLNLEQKVITDISPDDNGIDIQEATIELPKTFNFTLNHTGQSLEAGAASWNLYGQPINFAFDNTRPIRWSPEINRVLFPYKADVTTLEVLQCKSPVCTISGKAPIVESLWGLSAAVININAPLEADGTGAMAVAILQGIEASWMGLKDTNLFEKSSTQLINALVMLMPGRINIATFFAYNPGGKQRYNCWQQTINTVVQPLQCIDLQYTKQFFFFYDSLQKGTESVSAQANCFNSIDKPVQVNGTPFKVESLQTVFTLSISKDLQIVMLYDDDIIRDNFLKTYKPIPGAAPVVSFETTALALNNALLTVSPVYGMLLYGDLKTEDSFDKCVLIYSFGLLQYLPTLPDPYAANVSLLKRRTFSRRIADMANGEQLNKHTLSEINAMLVCIINWKEMDIPSVNFFLGDKPTNASLANAATINNDGVRIGNIKNQELIGANIRNNLSATNAIQNKNWQFTSEDSEGTAAMLNNDTATMMRLHDGLSQGNVTPFRNAFTLLDVSTNADLMGVSLGFSNDRLVFERTHDVVDDTNANPISIIGMDVHATSKLVQMYALPQISWEPVINITTEITNPAKDPLPGLLYFLNDGPPSQIANTGNQPVPLAPIPLSKNLTSWYKDQPGFSAWSFFTLPYGMLALAKYQQQADGNSPLLELVEQKFPNGMQTALQIKTAGLDDTINDNKKFFGSAHQLDNTYNLFFPGTPRSMLSGTVTEIFNKEFGSEFGFDLNMYVPLERYDFSGYGANVFSHWINKNAALAQTSQAMFDVWRGRTAHEVVQVKSVIYPWAIRVVRTVTIYRGSNGFPWRIDSGWKAESDGIYDFTSPIKDPGGLAAEIAEENAHAYKFHPGMVEGVYNIRNIKEDTTLMPFKKPWSKGYGVYIDPQGHPAAAQPPQALEIKMVPVYFDADVQIDDVTHGASNGKVLSQRMLGYLQLSPKGVFIDEESFAELLTVMNGLGGAVDCMVKINQTKQQMRITRVDVNPSMDAANQRVFVSAAKGTPVLPKDGSWSVVAHDLASKEVTPLSNNDVIPLVRNGIRNFLPVPVVPPPPNTLNYTQDKTTNPVNIAAATELFKDLESRAKQYGFLQSTGENKVLFRNPLFKQGENILKGSIPDLADAYRLMNSKGIFPKLEDLPKLNQVGELASQFGMNIIDEGYKLVNNTLADAEKKLVQELPEGPWYIVKTNDVKVYIEYKPTKPDPADNPPGAKAQLDFDIDSKAGEWVNKMNDITMVVDLVSFKRLLLIRGKFDTKKGQAPSFIGPELEFGPDLKPVVDILVLLSMIATDASYTDILKKGLKIAMSNSPNNWEYKFQADKEIPVLRFPPPLLDTAAAPLRLEAGLKVGVFFNVAIPLPPTNGIPTPSAGAFVEFYGKLSVMCVSVGVGTIYAVGQVTVRISADTVKGPALYMKFGFGVEAVVALPVIGSVSVYFAVGVEMSLDSTQITIGAFVLFKGRAEILGGIVTVTIQIEASGKVQKRIGGPAAGETNMIAQVTFSLDISICFIIDISFSESWQEQRQIS